MPEERSLYWARVGEKWVVLDARLPSDASSTFYQIVGSGSPEEGWIDLPSGFDPERWISANSVDEWGNKLVFNLAARVVEPGEG